MIKRIGKRVILVVRAIAAIGLCSGFLFVQAGEGQISISVPGVVFKQIPIIFHKNYDVSFWGIEKWLHPFDGAKYSKVAEHLKREFQINSQDFQVPNKITDQELLAVHTPGYLQALKDSQVVACIAEVYALAYLPNFILQWKVLDPMRYATAGTILGAQLALKYGWAINLSGGYHHAKAREGSGFCVFADISLAIKKVRETNPELKVLIVDLDAHQGNGHEAVSGPEANTFIFDMYSANNFPKDEAAKKYIDFNFPLPTFISTQDYLKILKDNLPAAIEQVKPDLIIYNAGTDVFEGDRLGRMRVSAQGIIERDYFVFSQALARKIPVLMLLSGGYSPASAGIIGASIENILKKENLVPVREKSGSSKPWFNW